MILLAGGTGTLGREVLPRLIGRGMKVRLLTRDPVRARDLAGESCEVVRGDLRDVQDLAAALQGIRTVISAVSGYGPNSGADPRSVDGAGNCELIEAAETAAVERFVLVSVRGAGPRHPMELMRMKFMAEQRLKGSRLAWTIIRPSPFMETWAAIVGAPLTRQGTTLVFGRGRNPINFVAVRDVAEVLERAVAERAMSGVEVEIGGPEDLTLEQFAAVLAAAAGTASRGRRIPRPAMRLLAALARPIKPSFARLAHDGVVMDTFDFTLDRARPCGVAEVGATSLAVVAGEVGRRARRPTAQP